MSVIQDNASIENVENNVLLSEKNAIEDAQNSSTSSSESSIDSSSDSSEVTTLSLRGMMNAKIHFGHKKRYRHPKMKDYIFGQLDGIDIINLDKTFVNFQAASNFATNIAKNGGTILFVGTRSHSSDIIADKAKKCYMPYVNARWLGGTLTNFETIKKSVKKLESKKAFFDKATSSQTDLVKKELIDLSKEITRMELFFGGIVGMKKLPDAVFIVDASYHMVVSEAKRLHIPVIVVVDSNNDPSGIDFAIPGNDDSGSAINYYADILANAINQGRAERKEKINRNEKD